MTEIPPTGAVAAALERYVAARGVIEHVLIAPGAGHAKHIDLHREAALFTLDVLARRTDAYFAQLLTRPEYRNRSRDEFFRITTDASRLTGHPITLDEFIGPIWDREGGQFLVADGRHLSGNDSVGYAYAFYAPPYNLSCPAGEAADLFRELTGALLGGFDEPLFVCEWATDCSNYFDAGREWWGTFFWTVESRDTGRVIGIAASATD